MPRRSKKIMAVEACIGHFLKEYRKNSHLDKKYGGAYYWNERDIQSALYSHLRERTVSYGLGSKWAVHPEGSIERPKYTRKEKWGNRRRADIVVIDHDGFKKAWRGYAPDYPPYEAMIEIKMIWPGWGQKGSLKGIKHDAEKLRICLEKGITKNGILVLLDGISRKKLPYYARDDIEKLKMHQNLKIYHWPDSEIPIEDLKEAGYKKY
jgi:hypothetical protein